MVGMCFFGRWPGAECRVVKIEAARRVGAAGLQPGGASNRFRSDVAVKSNSGIGREPTKPH